MIIESTQIQTGGTDRDLLANHVFRGPDNEQIHVVQGAETDLDDMLSDAKAHRGKGAKYFCRHIAITSLEPISRDQMRVVLDKIGAEFGFDPSSAVVVDLKMLVFV